MPRKPGRPSVDPEHAPVRVELTLPARVYDALYAAARRADVSVPEVIRRHLPGRRRPQDHEDDHE